MNAKPTMVEFKAFQKGLRLGLDIPDKKAAGSAVGTAATLDNRCRQLISQWRETARLYSTDPNMIEAASGYYECIAELEQILSGDLTAIERI